MPGSALRFALDADALPDGWKPLFVNRNDVCVGKQTLDLRPDCRCPLDRFRDGVPSRALTRGSCTRAYLGLPLNSIQRLRKIFPRFEPSRHSLASCCGGPRRGLLHLTCAASKSRRSFPPFCGWQCGPSDTSFLFEQFVTAMGDPVRPRQLNATDLLSFIHVLPLDASRSITRAPADWERCRSPRGRPLHAAAGAATH